MVTTVIPDRLCYRIDLWNIEIHAKIETTFLPITYRKLKEVVYPRLNKFHKIIAFLENSTKFNQTWNMKNI